MADGGSSSKAEEDGTEAVRETEASAPPTKTPPNSPDQSRSSTTVNSTPQDQSNTSNVTSPETAPSEQVSSTCTTDSDAKGSGEPEASDAAA